MLFNGYINLIYLLSGTPPVASVAPIAPMSTVPAPTTAFTMGQTAPMQPIQTGIIPPMPVAPSVIPPVMQAATGI